MLALSVSTLISPWVAFTATERHNTAVAKEVIPDRTPEILSLEEARKIAFLRNWDLIAAQANVDQAVAQKLVSKEFPNPTFSWSTQKINVGGGNTSSGTAGNSIFDRDYDTIVAINQLYEIGGKRTARQKSAQAGIESAEASFRDARRTLDLGVDKAYIAALLAAENVKILSQSAASLRREADIATARLKAGDISESDRGQIEIAADQLELNAEAAKNTAISSRIALEVLLGVKHPTGTWQASESLASLAGLPLDLHSGNPNQRPDVQSAEASLRKAGADLNLQKAMRIPDPTFLIQYEHNPPDQPTTVGIGVSFPLPLWNWNTGNIKTAEAARAQAAAQVGKVRTQVVADIATAEAAWDEAQRRWRRYESDVRPRSAKAVESVEYSYKKGGAALVDLLQAERSDNDVRVATAQAMADSATAAVSLVLARNSTLDSAMKSARKTRN